MGGRRWPKAAAAAIGPALLSSRSLCARIGSVFGCPPTTANHGDSAPARFCAGAGHRLTGCSFRAGWGAGMMPGRALALCSRCDLWPLVPLFLCALLTSDPCPFLPAPRSRVFSHTAGAGSGIGRAVSVRLAREGAAVAACDLDAAAAQETVRLLGGPGSEKGAPRGAHAAFQADVSEAGAARRLLEQVQVTASDLAPLKPSHCLHRPWLFVVFLVCNLPLP